MPVVGIPPFLLGTVWQPNRSLCQTPLLTLSHTTKYISLYQWDDSPNSVFSVFSKVCVIFFRFLLKIIKIWRFKVKYNPDTVRDILIRKQHSNKPEPPNLHKNLLQIPASTNPFLFLGSRKQMCPKRCPVIFDCTGSRLSNAMTSPPKVKAV